MMHHSENLMHSANFALGRTSVKRTDPVTEPVEEAGQRFERLDRYDRIKPVDPVCH